MSALNDLTTAAVSRITAAQNPGGSLAAAAAATVLREDVHDLPTEINKAIGRIGMLVLVGMPHFTNQSALMNPTSQLDIDFSIAIGEAPVLWRKYDADKNLITPTAADLALTVTQIFQNFTIAGFNPLRVLRGDFVPDKKRQIYELAITTKLIAQKITN